MCPIAFLFYCLELKITTVYRKKTTTDPGVSDGEIPTVSIAGVGGYRRRSGKKYRAGRSYARV